MAGLKSSMDPPVTWGLKVAVRPGLVIPMGPKYQRYQIRSHPAWRTFCQSTKVQGPSMQGGTSMLVRSRRRNVKIFFLFATYDHI